jgi:hypothetical protein
MTVRGKPGKPNPGFPPFPPPLEIAEAIPTFPPLRRLFLYKGEAKPPHRRINNLGWAKLNRRNGPSGLAKRTDISPEAAVAELGLKLVSQKARIEIIAVDHLEKPTEN